MQNKSGQVTIYIIIAVIIVVAVVLFLLLRTGLVPNPLGGETKNPNEYLSSCLEDPIANAVAKLGPQGGNINPTLYKNFKFSDEDKPYKVSYLCYNVNNYLPCVNQQPMLVSHVEEEIKKEIQGSAQDCFSGLEKSYRSAGYQTEILENGETEIKMDENKIVVNFNKKIRITKTGESRILTDLKGEVQNKILKLVEIAVRIVNAKTASCRFDIADYSMAHPQENIDFFQAEDGTEIYTTRIEGNNQFFRFAIRGKGSGC